MLEPKHRGLHRKLAVPRRVIPGGGSRASERRPTPTQAPSLRSRRPLAAALQALCASLLLTACASSHKSTHASQPSHSASAPSTQSSEAAEQAQALKERITGLAPPSKLAPGTVLAHVGSVAITFATVKQQMLLNSPQTPIPQPPSYTACIAREKASARAGSAPSEAMLQQSCRLSYEHLLQSSLSEAIHSQWLLGEAAEEGTQVSAKEVQEEFQATKRQFRTEAEFATYRKSTGQTIPDMMAELRLGKLTDRIFENIKRKEHPVSSDEVAAYYNAHREKFAIPEGRDVRILRMTSEASALRAKAELKAGSSFASIAKELSRIAQPITSKDGEVKDLIPHLFEEKKLNDAIFAAQAHRLYGPVTIVESHATIAPESGSGSYLFEVIKTIPGRQIPLAEVKAAIVAELSKSGKEKTLSSAIAAIKVKWRSRTDCEPGYIVPNCRQYTAKEAGIKEDPFTL